MRACVRACVRVHLGVGVHDCIHCMCMFAVTHTCTCIYSLHSGLLEDSRPHYPFTFLRIAANCLSIFHTCIYLFIKIVGGGGQGP